MIIIQATEDSDTIPYQCAQIIFKLERSGQCQDLVTSLLTEESNAGFDVKGSSADMIVAL